MAFYLFHHFDPDVSQRRLKPSPKKSKSLHDLSYVQNVKAGQLLAEFRPPASVKYKEARFLVKKDVFPHGVNTYIDPRDPHRLLASTKGYVTYDQGKICVFPVLKVHSDVCFHTGNILFCGDTAVAGDVRAGFEVDGDNVLITGMVEGGKIRGRKNIAVAGGVRGGRSKQCSLRAQKDVRVGFVEKAEIQCLGNIVVEKNCMHSTLYAGRNTLIKGRLVGGALHGRQGVFIGDHAGNSAATPTRIFLGYNPKHIRKLEKIDSQLESLGTGLYHLNAVAGHLPESTNDLTKKLNKIRKKNARLLALRDALWSRLQMDEEHIHHCKIVVMGIVFPGVEIAIGQAYTQIESMQQQVVFSLVNNEIICTPYTPGKK